MHTEQHENSASSCDSGIQSERNHYYTGKFMAAEDFTTDQNYQVSRHRLHNRLLHGWGIICGLEVKQHTSRDCKNRWVIVDPGAAMDCCGRELVVEKSMSFELPLPRPKGQGNPPVQGRDDCDEQEEMHEPFLLGLAYKETMIDYVPALYAENACDPQRQQPSRVREGVRLVCVPLHKVSAACWQVRDGWVHVFSLSKSFASQLDDGEVSPELRKAFAEQGRELAHDAHVDVQRKGRLWDLHSDKMRYEIRYDEGALNVWIEQLAKCSKDCDEEQTGGSCLEADCPCHGIVPLALVHFKVSQPEQGFHLHLYGRKHLPASADLLTHVIHTNWKHGEVLTLRQLREMKGKLRIRFDRKLLKREGDRTGINPMTFQVQYGGLQKTLEFMPIPEDDKSLYYDEDNCEAVFTIAPRVIEESHRKQANLEENWVYITLKCDFILDCHHIPVDGNHLRGHLPSGDGVPGGTFESWFYVGEEDEDYDRRMGLDREHTPNRGEEESAS